MPKNRANIASPATKRTRRFLISAFPLPASIISIIPVVIEAPKIKTLFVNKNFMSWIIALKYWQLTQEKHNVSFNDQLSLGRSMYVRNAVLCPLNNWRPSNLVPHLTRCHAKYNELKEKNNTAIDTSSFTIRMTSAA